MSMKSDPKAHRDPTWADVLNAVIVFDFLLVVMAIGIAGYSVYAGLEQAAYQRALSCDVAALASDCRDQRPAIIVDGGVAGGKGGGYHWVTTNVPGFADKQTKVWPALWETLYPGESVNVETWRGRITLINGVQTRDNPNNEAAGAIWMELVPAGLIALSLIPGVPALLITRHWRRPLPPGSAAA